MENEKELAKSLIEKCGLLVINEAKCIPPYTGSISKKLALIVAEECLKSVTKGALLTNDEVYKWQLRQFELWNNVIFEIKNDKTWKNITN